MCRWPAGWCVRRWGLGVADVQQLQPLLVTGHPRGVKILCKFACHPDGTDFALSPCEERENGDCMADLLDAPTTERRVHKVFVTRNTEYHVRRDLCVAVRDRRTGVWLSRHAALGRRLAGAIEYTEGGGVTLASQPGIGVALCFRGASLVTSLIQRIERPAREIVQTYRHVNPRADEEVPARAAPDEEDDDDE